MKTTLNKYLKSLSLAGIFVAAFFLSLKTTWSNIGLILIIATSFFSFFLNGFDTKWLKKKQTYLSPSWILFVPILFGIIYSPWFSTAGNEVTKSIFLLLMPLVVFRKDRANFQKYAVWGLIGGVAASAVYLLSLNFHEFFSGDYIFKALFYFWFTGMNFTEPIGMHPIYLGSYFVLALAFLAFEKTGIPKIVKVLLTILILMSIVFLNSRIIYFTTFVLGILFVLKIFSWKSFALLIGAIVISLALTHSYFQKTYIYNKIVYGTIWELTKNVDSEIIGNVADSRMSRWLVAIELIEGKPLIGYGTGTEDRLLLEKYKEYNMQISVEQGYNSHNQFLAYLIQYGAIGTLFLIGYFLFNLFPALKWKDYSYLFYLLLLGSVLLVENYLDRNMGLNFVALFGTLFFLKSMEKNQEIKN